MTHNIFSRKEGNTLKNNNHKKADIICKVHFVYTLKLIMKTDTFLTNTMKLDQYQKWFNFAVNVNVSKNRASYNVGGSRICHTKMCLFGILFKLVIFKT